MSHKSMPASAINRNKVPGRLDGTWASGMLLVLLLVVPSIAQAEFKYTTNNGAITITKYIGSDSDVTIPDTIDGLPVTAMGSSVFCNCQNLTKVTIPNSVTRLGSFVFADCTSLTDLTIPNRVTRIERGTFSGCVRLRHFTLPDSVTNIGIYAFSACTSLTNVTIPGRVTTIEASAFTRCDSLPSVTLPNSLLSIGLEAFAKATSLTNITIPGSVTNIGDWAFTECRGLLGVTISTGISRIGRGMFSICTSLTNVTIPSSVTNIEANAFSSCLSLATLTIPSSVTTIGGSAFASCRSLSSVTIPGSVTTVGYAAFRDCVGLTNVTLPGSVTSIGAYAFFSCTNLTRITVPGSVTNIGVDAFVFCPSPTNVTICHGVTNLGQAAFYYSYPRTNGTITIGRYDGPGGAVTIPESLFGRPVTSIGGSAFSQCAKLTSVRIPDSVTNIGGAAFSGCSSLTNFKLPGGLRHLGDSAFRCCTALTSVAIGKGLDSVGSYAFYGCSSLTNVALPDTVTRIGEGAFFDCPKLTRINVPNGVTNIGSLAFSLTTRLTNETPVASTPLWESQENLQIVFSGTSEQKAALVAKLAKKKDPRLAGWLLETAKRSENSSAYQAAVMLVDMGYDGAGAYDDFLKLLKETRSPIFRRLGALGLGNNRDPQAIDALAVALHDDSRAVQVEAALALGRIGGDRAGEILLKERRASARSAEIVAVMSMALGLSCYTKAVPDLVQSLQQPNPTDMAAAFRSSMPPIVQTNIGSGQSPFRELLAYFGEERYAGKLTAAIALGRMGGEDAVQGLMRALTNDTDSRVRAGAAQALGEALATGKGKVSAEGETRAKDSLVAATHDSDQQVRECAAQSLQMIKRPKSDSGTKEPAP